MTPFPESLLDEIRQRLTLETVARAHQVHLKRAGAELKALSPFQKENTPSFTINPTKGIWKCFASGKGGNDVFSLKMALAGGTFVRAVEELAALAGVPLPGHTPRPAPASAKPPEQRQSASSAPKGKREVAKVYDYTDADGGVVYQVCRFQFRMPDGSWETDTRGRVSKTFAQRRHYHAETGRFIWGLGAGEYMRKGPGADWYAYNEDNFKRWNYRERMDVATSVDHGLYCLEELLEEIREGEDARIIWLPEGEKDVDTLRSWGLVATTNSGGAKNWKDHHAQLFAGMRVVIPIDNDKAGHERGHKIALSLRGIAESVRVLDPRDYWTDAPEGGDVTDWREAGQGSREKLLALVDKTPDWTPAPPESAFNAQRFVDLDRPGREYEWLIKHLITRGETSVWYGPPSCGKSFLITDASLAIARGVSWMGQRVRQGLAVYVAAEGGLGLRKRLRAWRKAHNVTPDENIPFVLLPMPINLFVNETDLLKLIAEIKAWAAFYDVPLELVVLDTLAAITAGANENASEHMGLVLARCRRIAIETGAHVALVHHTPKEGDNPRGWTGITGNVENVVQIIATDQTDFEETPGGRIGRKIRTFVTRKQKDEESDFSRSFVLKQVKLGEDIDGDPITSCIVEQVGAKEQAASSTRIVPAGYKILTPNNLALMRGLATALKTKAVPYPKGVKCPEYTYCVRISDWQEVMRNMLFTNDPDDPHGKKLRGRVKKSIERTYDGGKYDWTEAGQGLIGKDGEWVWRTDRKVHDVDPPPVHVIRHIREDAADHSAPEMLLAPGEDPHEDDKQLF